MFFLPLVAAAALVGGSVAVAGDPSPEATRLVYQGADGIASCASCHQPNGWGDFERKAPSLSGLDPEYMAAQIRNFAAGNRKNELMDPIAKALNETQIAETTALYANLPKRSDASPPADPELAALGARIATRGAWDREIPACEQCHGPGGQGVDKNFPALAGQRSFYIQAQLNAWRSFSRKGDPNGMMKGIAERLSAREIEAVAAYYDSLGTAPAAEAPAAAPAAQPEGAP
ncbi:MAG: c-type cytochrome [Myxococcales bacterium]|nr:c-type cytochrome [Myxococcales bacterium]